MKNRMGTILGRLVAAYPNAVELRKLFEEDWEQNRSACTEMISFLTSENMAKLLNKQEIIATQDGIDHYDYLNQ